MTTLTDTPPATVAYAPGGPRVDSRPYLLLLAILFIGSGCAALIYEIVWLQLLQLVIGASAISLGVLLGTFMGGMCLGSLLLSKVVSRSHHPLRIYALLEVLIGLFGLLALVAVPTLGNFYTHLAQPGAASVALRAIIAGLCLLPPTLLMGATLPAIARYVEATPKGVSWLGFFYGGNIVGAVFGCLLAGFYLLRLYDMPHATYVAFGINVAVALLALGLSTIAPHSAPVVTESKAEPSLVEAGEQGPAWLVYTVIGISGLTGLGAEVVWTRLLSLMLGATVYTFSIILAVFLFGLGIGSTVGAGIARNTKRPRTALAMCQFLLALGIAWAAFAIGKSLPFWPISLEMTPSPWVTFQLDLVRALWTLLPAAILWGASFPLALASVPARRNSDAGALVGRVYAANTVGAILGSLGFSVMVIPGIGTLHAEQLLMGLCMFSALLAVAPLLNVKTPQAAAGAVAGGLVAASVATWALVNLPVTPWIAVAFGRNSATWMHEGDPVMVEDDDMHLIFARRYLDLTLSLNGDRVELTPVDQSRATPGQAKWVAEHQVQLVSAMKKQAAGGHPLPELNENYYTDAAHPDPREHPDRFCTYVGEGMNVSVAVTYMPDTSDANNPHLYRYFHGAGKVQASSDPADMRLQRSLGHLTALVHDANPSNKPAENVLVVACGAGVTAGSFVPYDTVKSITICDIEPMVPTHVSPLFHNENYNVVGDDVHNHNMDPRTKVVLDDGRHFVRTTKEKFDIITSDPIDPWVKGCAALNTIEYYQMCREHLNPGGVMALWIPLYENNEESAKSIIATFFKVFPHGILWSNDISDGQGYDAVLFGTPDECTIDVDAVQHYLDTHTKVRDSLTEVGFGHNDPSSVAVDLLSTFAADTEHLKPWTDNAQLNEDKNLRLQYLAGMWVNKQMQAEILNNILKCYAFPSDIFKGTPETIRNLKMNLIAKKRVPADVRGGMMP